MRPSFIQSVDHACRGIKTVWNEERNFKIQSSIAILVLLTSYLLHFSFIEFSFVIIAILLVVSAEIINTAIEDICNKIEPEIHPIIRKIKDIMAGFVLINALGALLIGILVLIHHFI